MAAVVACPIHASRTPSSKVLAGGALLGFEEVVTIDESTILANAILCASLSLGIG